MDDAATVPDGVIDDDVPKEVLAVTAAVVDADADTPTVVVAVMALDREAVRAAVIDDAAVPDEAAVVDADTPTVADGVAAGDADAVAAGVVVIAAVGEGVCGGVGVMLGVDASGTMHDWMTTEPAAPAPLTGAPPT